MPLQGAQVFQFPSLLTFVENVFNQKLTPASPADLARFNSTDLGTVNDLGDYLWSRAAATAATINLKNSIAENDPSMTPMQFVYEAADCRFWWTKEMLFNVSKIWERAADVMWNTENGSQWCVEGSISHPSSLSGDQELGGGAPTNISSFPALAREYMGPAPKLSISGIGMAMTIASFVVSFSALAEWV